MQSSSFASCFSDELINESQRSTRCVVLMRKSTDLLLDQVAWDTIRELLIPPSMNDRRFRDPLAKDQHGHSP
jgi:hypothetical protein